MRKISRVVVSVGALAIAACAAQRPATPPASEASPHPQGAPTASGGSQGTPTGYYRKVIDGQEVFCRNDPDLGSRVQRSEKCLTREQLDEEQRNSHNVMQDIQRSGVR